MAGGSGPHALDRKPGVFEARRRQHEQIGMPRRHLDRRAGEAGKGDRHMPVAEWLRAGPRAFQAMEAAFEIDRFVVGPQPPQQHDVFVEPGKVLLMPGATAGRIDVHADAAAAQLIERGDLACGDFRRDDPGAVLDVDIQRRGRVQHIGSERRHIMASVGSSISRRSMPAASAAVATSASAERSIVPPAQHVETQKCRQ